MQPAWLAPSRLLLRLIVIALLVGALPNAPISKAQSEANQAGLVVMHGDGRVVKVCVAFSETEISGLQLLQRSGLDLNIDTGSGMGGAVCRINEEGCSTPHESCFCRCTGADCAYWSYWRNGAAGWEYSKLGAANTIVKPGSIEGWVWGPGAVDSAPKPPVLALSDICQAATAIATPSPTPPATETPTETLTPIPTPIPTSTPTLLPTSTFAPLNTSTTTATPAPSPTSSPPRIELFAADRTQVTVGETTTLHWRVTDATGIVLRAGAQAVAVSAEGATTLAPPQSIEVWLEASNSGGVSRSLVQITVVTPPTLAPTVIPPTAAPPTLTPAATLTPTPIIAALPTAADAPPSAPVTARIWLPLVMMDTLKIMTAPPTATVAPTVAIIVAATPTALVFTPIPAVAAVALPPAQTFAPVVTGAISTAGVVAEGIVEAENPFNWVNLLSAVLLTLAALLVLPVGLGTAGYLLWRTVRGRVDKQ